MKARYATVCAACGGRVQPGEEIKSSGAGKGGWAHVGCDGGMFAVEGMPAGPSAAGRSASTRSTTKIAKASPKAPKARRPVEALPVGVTAVYTDGACSGNPGPGGWAWAVKDGRQGSGGENPSTNQRMEVQAALEAVRSVPDSPLVVVSDSTYVVNCFRDGWWRGWLARDWRNSQKQPVANRDLWEPLIELVRSRGDVTFSWVKGHSGDAMNDLVDQLAVAAAAAAARQPQR